MSTSTNPIDQEPSLTKIHEFESEQTTSDAQTTSGDTEVDIITNLTSNVNLNNSNEATNTKPTNVNNDSSNQPPNQYEDELISDLTAKLPISKQQQPVSRIQQPKQPSHLSSGMSFQDPSLQIPQPILDALIHDLRFEVPSEIQAVTIPRIVRGKNIIAQAQTGSGKTIAFAIGMLCAVDASSNCTQAICLTPTRELAIQIIDDAIVPLSKYMPGITHELLVPDEPGKQTRSFGKSSSAHIIVGTPGTVKLMIQKRYLQNLKRTVKVFVCDEADTMVDQQHLGQVTVEIKSQLNPLVQTLFFSATYSDTIINFSKHLMQNAAVIKLKTNTELLLNNIFQVRIDVTKRPNTGEPKKIQILKEIYGFFDIEQSIIFVTTRAEATAVAHMFLNEKYSVSYLHGDLGPTARDEEFKKFREGKTKVLITTNVLARGVNVPSVDVVINYDLPIRPVNNQILPDPDTYVHRMGRCGRFGRQGTAITLLQTAQDEKILLDIEKYFNYTSSRMTQEWDANQIESLGDTVREKSTVVKEPVHLECKVEVQDHD